MIICATSARVAVPVGSSMPSPFPLISPFSTAQETASRAQVWTVDPSLKALSTVLSACVSIPR